MEHLGCFLISDFHDYYDLHLSSTSYSHESKFIRLKSDPITPKEQYRILSSAGLTTAIYGPLNTVIAEIYDDDFADIETVPSIVVYEKDGEAKLVSLKESFGMDQDRFSSLYIATSPDFTGTVLKYIKIGYLYAWVLCESSDHWKSNYGNITYKIINPDILAELDAKHLVHLKDPLYSIDFVVYCDTLYAINYSKTPNLKDLGIDSLYNSEFVAKAIMTTIDNSTLSGECCNDQSMEPTSTPINTTTH
jgi:hypothetical protein